jgi:hypothetical protein
MDRNPTDRFEVDRIPPGAEGVAVSWGGPRDRRIELLDAACNVVGTFETSDGVNYFVAGVPGLSGSILPWTIDHGKGPISAVDDCGGWTSM